MSVSCFEQNHTRRYETCTVSLRPSSQLRHNPARLKKSSQAGAAPTRAHSVIRLKKRYTDHDHVLSNRRLRRSKCFFREVAPPDAPALLFSDFLAHVPRTDRYHVLAPDLPGSGFTDAPDRTNFTYSFDHLTDVIERFTEVLGPRSGCAHL